MDRTNRRSYAPAVSNCSDDSVVLVTEGEDSQMLLEQKNAIVYGAGGTIGSAVAKAFGREGARVFAVGRTSAPLEAVAEAITTAGEMVETAQVDAGDREAVEAHAESVATAGGIDVSMNAVSFPDLQGRPLVELPVEDFETPIRMGTTAHFLTATAAARHMMRRGSGAILTLSSTGARLSGRDRRFHLTGGFGVACSAIESFSHTLAGEVGKHGVRVVCLRPDAIAASWPNEGFDERDGQLVPSEVRSYMTGGTVLDRLPTPAEVADTAAFVASDRGSAMSATVVNLSCGSLVE